MDVVITAIVAGLLMAISARYGLQIDHNFCWAIWSRAGNAYNPERLSGRVQVAFLAKPLVLYMPVVLGIVNPIWCMLFLQNDWQSFPFYYALTYLLASFVGFLLVKEKYIAEAHARIACDATHAMARLGPLPGHEALLLELAKSPTADMRKAAVIGLVGMGTATSLQAVKTLRQDPDEAVRYQADLEEHAYTARANRLLSPKNLEKKLAQLQLVGRSLYVDDDEGNPVVVNQQRLYKEIDKIVFSQVDLRPAFPHLYCVACNDWAEERSQMGWRWVRCRNCHEVKNLKAGVESVVGQIGGFFGHYTVKGKLHLEIWDERTHKAQVLGMKELLIFGGRSINYDWAVSKVVEMVTTHFPKLVGKIKVKLVEAPPIERNTMALLRTLDPQLVL